MERPAHGKYPLITEVTDAEHVGMVREIFSTIAENYDFLNHLLSAGQDIAWRRFAVRKMRFSHTYRFLDVATGTADLAIEATRKHPRIHTTGVDFVWEMMDLGRLKIEKRRLSNRIRFLMSDALDLPFPQNSFDVAAIAFGIRNTADRIQVLREMTRVVVPGGQVMVLEMTVPQNRIFRTAYLAYLTRILPTLARVLSPNPAAYSYLADSITNFPTGEGFVKLMEEAGLIGVERYSLTLGITHLFVGLNPPKTG